MKDSQGKEGADGDQAAGQSTTTGQQASKDAAGEPKEGGKAKESGKAEGTKGGDPASTSMHSQLTSSLLETSEDEEAKKKEQEKADKKAKKGLSEKDLEAIIDIELCETNTFDLMFIPSQLV
jgi:hypothetical protein